ncbi:MAG: endonuclease domain-containing protein [Acidobacteriaceae bacterium]
MSDLECELALHIRASKLPAPIREFRFSERKYRADFAWPENKLLVEVNGGTWVKSGHSSGKGIARDYEKSNLAQRLGFVMLHFTGEMVKSGEAIKLIEEFFKEMKGESC